MVLSFVEFERSARKSPLRGKETVCKAIAGTRMFSGFGLPCVCFGLRAYNSRSRPKVEALCLTKLVEVVSKLVGSSQKDIVRCVTKGNNLNHIGNGFLLDSN